VLGWEADYAGTSFATTEKLGKFQYGSRLVNFLASRTHPNFRSSLGYDDEGVKSQQWHLVKDGILVGYATDRSVAAFIGDKKSHGCAYADSWSSMPIIRMPNVVLAPGGKGAPTPEELIADTKDAIYIEGTGSYSIDHQRRNFQFGGDAFWEVKNGKKTRMLKNVTYQSNTPEFWNSIDAICGIEDWKPYGTPNCGKGQPGQRAQMTHACSTVRARNINVGGAKI
jgi:TldD protein